MSQTTTQAPARNQLVSPETEQVEQKLATLRLTGATAPLQLGKSLNGFQKTDSTPLIGTEFARGVQIAELLKAPNADELIRDLAILGKLPISTALIFYIEILSAVSQRGVVFFRDQELTINEQKLLGTKLGELTGKPASSKLHIHPVTAEASGLGDEISVISSERNREYITSRSDRSTLSA